MDNADDGSCLSLADQRLIGALQCDVRVSAERAGAVLGVNPRTVARRWTALLGDGTVRLVAGSLDAPAAMVLRIRVLRGALAPVVSALAAREDVPFVDVSAGGDEIVAVVLAESHTGNGLVFRRLPATKAVTSVDAQTILHVFADASRWRLDVLTAAEREALEAPRQRPGGRARHAPDDQIEHLLRRDPRVPASSVAAQLGAAESSVRRRISELLGTGTVKPQVVIDPRRIGLPVDANLLLHVPPAHLEGTGRALAAHPAVHGALAVTGPASLHLAVWLPDLAGLYAFITQELARHPISAIETILVGRAVKRAGVMLASGEKPGARNRPA